MREDGRYYTMHTDEVEGYDVYMTNDTLTYDYAHADYTVELEREASKSLKEISHVSLYAGRHGRYAGDGSVSVETPLEGQPEAVSNTVLAPTTDGEQSTVKFDIYGSDATAAPLVSTGNIDIDMERNRIEVVRLDAAGGQGEVKVYILVNSQWKQVYDLELGE